MARLQILQLPEGAGDDRPPFVLVVDQVDDAFRHELGDPNTPMRDAQADFAKALGARAVLVFRQPVEIPANDLYPSAAAEEARALLPNERAQVAEEELKKHEIRHRVDSESRAMLAQDLGLGGRQHWDALRAAVINLQKGRDEARVWARHGYEIGQRHCSWSDHGVAPDWLSEGWPHHFDSCEHLARASEYDTAIGRALQVADELEEADVHGSAYDANQEAARLIRSVLRPSSGGESASVS